MYGLVQDLPHNIKQEDVSKDNSLSTPVIDLREDQRLDQTSVEFKRPKNSISLIEVSLSPSGLRENVGQEKVNPLYDWCESKGISPQDIVDIVRVLGRKDPLRDSVHIYLADSNVRKISEAVVRDINRPFRENGVKLFAVKQTSTADGDALLLYLKRGKGDFILALKPVSDISKMKPKTKKYRLENEIKNAFKSESSRFELAI